MVRSFKVTLSTILLITITTLTACGPPHLTDDRKKGTLLEEQPFRITALYPSNENAPTDALISLTFSRPVDTTTIKTGETGSLQLKTENTRVTFANSFTGIDGTTITFLPEKKLEENTLYTISLAPEITSISGEPLSPYTGWFKTKRNNQRLNYFTKVQEFPTFGNHDIDTFTMDGTKYMAVANYYQTGGKGHSIESELYYWNGGTFKRHSLIPTMGAFYLEYFTVNGEHYLASANHYNGSTGNIDSTIFKWNGTGFTTLHQRIPTNWAFDCETFFIGNRLFMTIANYYNGSTHNIPSRIYEWKNGAFDLSNPQEIPTMGAWNFYNFTIEGTHYFVISNYYNGSTHNLNSCLYIWNGSSFTHFQNLSTSGAMEIDFFTIEGKHFLSIANHHNDSTYNINSNLYRWDGSGFKSYQAISTNGAEDMEHFTIGKDHYLVIANHNNSSTKNIDSRLYKWNGTYFDPIQPFPTHGAVDWHFFEIEGNPYIAVANHHNGTTYNVNSFLYKGIVTESD